MMYDYKFHPEAEKELAKLNRLVQILIHLVAIGKRHKMDVYKKAGERRVEK